MIVVKARCESEELLMFRSLNLRMELTRNDAYYYSNLEKGYEGECQFDQLVESQLPDDWLAINDLLLECNNTIFQIDSLLIGYGIIFVNDVKNYDGDFIIKDGKWYTVSGNEVSDPLDQLKRCESLLRRLLHHLGFTLPIESRIVFINPEFYLYHAPLSTQMIFFPQLNRFMNQLKMKSGKLDGRQFKVAHKLVSLNKKTSVFSRVPEFQYEQLEKGVACRTGKGFMNTYNKHTLVCNECGCHEDVESAILRNVAEFRLLFPDQKITTNAIYKWCKIIPKKTIWRILAKNFKYQGHGRTAHFVDLVSTFN